MKVDADRVSDWALTTVFADVECTEVLIDLLDASLDIFDEINESDAKSPKELMHQNFGVSEIEEVIDGLFDDLS